VCVCVRGGVVSLNKIGAQAEEKAAYEVEEVNHIRGN
jgi:hypothetical protein